jgi:oxalate decarboxylase
MNGSTISRVRHGWACSPPPGKPGLSISWLGFVPFAMGHYVENTGMTPLRFLEIFKSDYYADVSLNQWLALTPPELVNAHLKLGSPFAEALRKNKVPVVPV